MFRQCSLARISGIFVMTDIASTLFKFVKRLFSIDARGRGLTGVFDGVGITAELSGIIGELGGAIGDDGATLSVPLNL